ncbi:hypothetical protein ABZW47_17095 [Streptomyces sp. NPDC004549]|uniref:hypothetical protein n=1 Tax=unclassified Streptomyces TaxID=2593676 RepID=UPI0018F2B109|nr:hypothetical protein [Streptomyces sp. DSM 110735]MBJ7904935.1 hypothetical protein [Streptomyces sp. DSM 110735]
MRRTALAAVCLATAAAAGLTGCLSGADTAPKGPFAGLSGGQIADRAMKTTTKATTLRMRGTVTDGGDDIKIDMALSKKGECAGTMGMGGKGSADLIKSGDTIYMKYNEAFLRDQGKGESKADTDAVVNMMADKWTKMAATGKDAKDIAGFCDLDTVLAGAVDVNSDATRGKTTTIDGTPAITLHEKDGKDRYTLYVATKGKPYLLRVDSSAGAKEPVHLSFLDYEKPVEAKKPAGKILDLDALGG